MRTCLSFLVVELMRQGKSPQEACRLGISRMLELETAYATTSHPNPDQSMKSSLKTTTTMHTGLVVGVVAMDPLGNVEHYARFSKLYKVLYSKYLPYRLGRRRLWESVTGIETPLSSQLYAGVLMAMVGRVD